MTLFSKITSPLVGSSNPPNILRVVVFPHPLGPNKVKNSFFFMFKSIFFKTSNSSYSLQIFFNSITLILLNL